VPRTLRDILIALSLSNLCFMSGWRVLANPLHYTYYHWKYHPGFSEYIALAINIFLLAFIFWGAITLARRSGKQSMIWLARWMLLLVLILPVNSLRIQLFDPNVPSRQNWWGGLLLMGIFSVVVLSALVLRRWRLKILRTAVSCVLILFPFALITFSQGAWLAIKYRSNADLANDDSPAPASNSMKKDAPRVLWIVFDELDQKRAFSERAGDLALPELDRLRSGALFASNAYPPAGETLLSLPSLIMGKVITTNSPVRPDETMIAFKGSTEQTVWSTQPNVFSEARAAGFNTALVGWYHPYCRVIADDLTSCFWEPVVDNISPLSGRPTVLKSMELWAQLALFRIPGMFRLFQSKYDSDRCENHIQEYLQILEHAKVVVKNRDFGLVFLHLPIPHHPFIYDRFKNALSSRPDRNYEDNLALTDRTLGELRREMEGAGLWEDTTVIVTSDHWWRTPIDGKIDKRIPFIIKLARQNAGMTYEAKFNTVLTSRIVTALLKGEVTTADTAVKWLERNRSSE
jgi:hypothetical protein